MLFKLSFYVLPNSSENKICGLHDGAYKIKLKKIIQFQVDEGEIEAIKKTLSAFK